MITIALIGQRDCIALNYFANTIQNTCKLQKRPFQCRLILIEPAKWLQTDACEKNSLPYIGRTKLAALAYYNYDPSKSIDDFYFRPHNWTSPHKTGPIPPAQFEMVVTANVSVEPQFQYGNCMRLIIDGQPLEANFIVQSQNTVDSTPLELDKGLRAIFPNQPPSNFFVCGQAACFSTSDSRALSGIFVAQYIKTFHLRVMRDYFTVVTSNQRKADEYRNICGPIHRADPRSALFATNLSVDAMEEGFMKQNVIRLEIQKRGGGNIIHQDSDYWFIDANSLSVFSSNDPVYHELQQQYHQYVLRYLNRGDSPTAKHVEKVHQQTEDVRLFPGTDVKSWTQFLDQYPDQGEMQNGHHAHWRYSVALVSKTANRVQEDATINDLSVYDATMHNGMAEGVITYPPRGENGFGFDSRYEPVPRGCTFSIAETFGEMHLDKKSQYSARAEGILYSLYSLVMKDVFQKLFQ